MSFKVNGSTDILPTLNAPQLPFITTSTAVVSLRNDRVEAISVGKATSD
jgi:hypothetical protein